MTLSSNALQRSWAWHEDQPFFIKVPDELVEPGLTCLLSADGLPHHCYWDLAIQLPKGAEILDFRGMNYEVKCTVGSPYEDTTYHLKGYSMRAGEEFVTVVPASFNAFIANAKGTGTLVLNPGEKVSAWDHLNDEE